MKKITSMFMLLAFAFGACKKGEIKQEKPDAEPPQSSYRTTAVGDGTLTDTNIRYFGRWDFSSPTQYTSSWGGAYLKVNFTGTTVKAKLGTITTNYYAKIDNGPWIGFIGVNGTVNLTPTPLAAGTHSLILAEAKDSYYVYNFQGLILDAGAITNPPSVANDLIEWVGDSITAGWTDPRAALDDYAWVCSEMMGTEHTQIAYPGILLTSGFTTNPGMETGYFKLKSPNLTPAINWDFTKYNARLVVINLGTNDQNKMVPDATFQTTYTTFLANVREKFPNAYIFVLQCFLNGIKSAPTLAAVNARNAAGDNNVIYVNTTNWVSSSDYNDGLHPSVSGHIKIANLLKNVLSPYLSSATSLYLDHCDATTGWVSANALTISTLDKKEGTGALQSSGSGTDEFKRTFTGFNSGATAGTGSLQFWYYVSDVTKLAASNQIELGSGSGADINEYSWNIGPLHNGWNLITKTFSSASITGGTPNLNSLKWFRVYHAKTGSVVTKVDGLRINH